MLHFVHRIYRSSLAIFVESPTLVGHRRNGIVGRQQQAFTRLASNMMSRSTPYNRRKYSIKVLIFYFAYLRSGGSAQRSAFRSSSLFPGIPRRYEAIMSYRCVTYASSLPSCLHLPLIRAHRGLGHEIPKSGNMPRVSNGCTFRNASAIRCYLLKLFSDDEHPGGTSCQCHVAQLCLFQSIRNPDTAQYCKLT